MQIALRRPSGMAAFSLIWLGQLVSLVGTGMTQLALGLWAWQSTGSATALALVTVFANAPVLLLSPIAGALVDRWDRKAVMILTDLTAGLASVAIFALHGLGLLQIWHLYVAAAFVGAFQSFQWPAYSAAVAVMLPKEQYGRANGMLSLTEAGSAIAAPILAGVLIVTIGIGGVLLIDIVTFLFAIGMLLLVTVPAPERSAAGAAGQGSLWRESLYGFRYILERPGLLGLQLTFLAFNLLSAFSMGLAAPYILARSGDDAQALGAVMSAFGVGGVAGGMLMSVWGGPQRRVYGLLLGMAASSLIGVVPLGLGRSLPAWVACALVLSFFLPIVNGSSQAIWQAKVAPDVQGRVFASRRMIAQITFPLGLVIAGPLADMVFEPALRSESGALAGLLAPLVGTGPGAGMGLMFVISGILSAGVALAALLIPTVREVEARLPDHG